MKKGTLVKIDTRYFQGLAVIKAYNECELGKQYMGTYVVALCDGYNTVVSVNESEVAEAEDDSVTRAYKKLLDKYRNAKLPNVVKSDSDVIRYVAREILINSTNIVRALKMYCDELPYSERNFSAKSTFRV